MTERAGRHVERSRDALRIGPSQVRRTASGGLEWQLDERAAPWPRRVRGQVRLEVPQWLAPDFVLDAAGRHRWQPYATAGRVEVAFEHPSLRWSGPAYLDGNAGSRPLEADFARWDWARATLADGATAVLYDVERRDASRHAFGLRVERDGHATRFAMPSPAPLPASGWGLARTVGCDAGSSPQLLQGLEDGPFYARALVGARWLGEPVRAFHESLSLERFSRRWVQALLPFRMPRRG